jgi:hypothetical protein
VIFRTAISYQEALQLLDLKKAELERTKAKYQGEVEVLTRQHEEASGRLLTADELFRKMRADHGRLAVMSRTGKTVKPAELNAKECALSAKDVELERERVRYIETKAKHRQTEDELSKQDQLSEGLHLIDFEQLKIENQSLNEKKSDKQRDIIKIETKISVNAHMLSHVKEKLAFVRRQRLARIKDTEQVDEAYGRARARLAQVKTRRDMVREQNASLKKSSGLIGMGELLYDFEARTNELEALTARLAELKGQYSELLASQHELEAKIAQRRPIDPALLRMNR